MTKIRQFILKDKEIFVGLEDSKRSWKVCVRSGGIIVNEASMPTHYDKLRNYFTNKFPGCTITVLYEAGFRGFGLHDKLLVDGWKCVVTPPHTVTQEKCLQLKNDRLDCRRLAKNLENNDYRKCRVPDQERREDRQLSRTYCQVQKDIVRVCNRIRRMVEFHGLDEQFPPGRWTRTLYLKLGTMLAELNLSSSLFYSLQTTFNELHMLWEMKKNVMKHLMALAQKERYKETVNLLKSAPGIGNLTAIRLALEWGELNGDFTRKQDFASFVGLIPSDYSTGAQDHKGHITKQGNRAVRAWLIESAWVAIRKDPALLDKYQIVCHNNSGMKKKAIVAVARKLALRLRAILTTRQPYVIGKLE
jgi:transposase